MHLKYAWRWSRSRQGRTRRVLPKSFHRNAPAMSMRTFNLVEFHPLLIIENLTRLGIGFLHDSIALRIQGGNVRIVIMIDLIEL